MSAYILRYPWFSDGFERHKHANKRRKKLVTLLHLKLPPEIHLSKARASLLRVTFLLEFGVPQISIEVDGIQVQARLVDDVKDVGTGQPGGQNSPQARPSAPRHPSPSFPRRDDMSDSSSDDEHVPTVDELANSFIREEPADEIRELEQELETQSAYMQESIASSDSGDDESSAGMGAPLALPTYLRNILNTALDRLSIVVSDIDIEMEDHFSPDTTTTTRSAQSSPVTLNFHVERIAVDSITSTDLRVQDTHQDLLSKSGKRRLHVQNICARLVSDAENFISLSKLSRPSSPETTRSEFSTSHQEASEPSASQTTTQSNGDTEADLDQVAESDNSPASIPPSLQSSMASLHGDVNMPAPTYLHEQISLASSVHTVDDDRFADAASDDGLDEDLVHRSPEHPRYSPGTRDLGGSSILYDDGLLDYAMQNSLLNSRFDDAPIMQASVEDARSWRSDGAGSTRDLNAVEHGAEESTSTLPTVSALGRSFRPPSAAQSPSQSSYSDRLHLSDLPTVSTLGQSFRPPSPIIASQSSSSEPLQPSTDNLQAARLNILEHPRSPETSFHQHIASPPSPEEDLAESQLFSHDDAESMYMSAISAAPTDSKHGGHIPGGWDSSSTSSRSNASDRSGSVPEAMISGSILAPLPEHDDGTETPRPGSRQSSISSPHVARAQTPDGRSPVVRKQAKIFLTIDEITVWFPLGLDGEEGNEMSESTAGASGLDFKPPNLGEDSIFAEMPGSFSNYAHSSSHRRKPSLEESARRRPNPRSLHSDQPAKQKKSSSLSISVAIGSIAGHMDLSTGRVMFGIVNRVVQALASEPTAKEEMPKTKETPKDITSSIEVTVKHFGIAWLENIMVDSFIEGQVISRQLGLQPVGAILALNLSAIHVTQQTRTQESRAKLQIGKFVITSLDQEIISFQSSRPRSRRSVIALPEQLNNDVEIDYEQAKEKRITVVTRPVKVQFDIQSLDDALGSFGGFSGVLELSSSMSSNNTIHSPVLSAAPPRPRGVHFGDSVAPATKAPTASASVPKIQVQFGEVTFLLKGKSCAVQLQTTSVRIAVRESNVRLKISEIQLSGPYVQAGQIGSPLLVEIRGTTVNFLFAPEETDLAKLISMITPTKDPYENNDDILIETLLRQRRKGSVLRIEVGEVGVRLSDLEQMKTFEALGAELSRLSKVTKYLPDDDRPGLLTLATVKKFDATVQVSERLGDVAVSLQDTSAAHVGVPALLAVEVGNVTVVREDEILVHEVVKLRQQDQLPAIMVRMVGDEMEPVVKVKLFNLCAEYRVSTVMAALGLSEDGTADDIALGIASSVATITGTSSPRDLSRQSTQASSTSTTTAKPLQIDLLLRNCAVGLNPRNFTSKGLFVLTETHIAGKQVKTEYSIIVELRKASIHAIDDTARLEEEREPAGSSGTSLANRHLNELSESGYISLSSISAAKVLVNITGDGKDQPQLVDVEFKNDLFVIEACADSTQTLIGILNGLQPPIPPSTAEKYRTVVPLQEMMQSFTGDALMAPEDGEDGEDDDFMNNADLIEDELPTNLEFVGSCYNSQSLPTDEELGDDLLDEDDLGALASPPITRQRGDRALLESFQEKYEVQKGEDSFDFSDNYFRESDAEQTGKAKKWDSTKNQYHLSNEFKVPDAPLKVRVRDVNIIWNLYDGYDWPRTRSIISQAVDDVESRAEERRRNARDDDEDDDFVEEDFLFNSVWIGVPVKDEKGALARRINHDIDDLASETGSYATSTNTRSTGATARPKSSHKSRRRLKLERSKHKKIAFSLMGVAVDLIVFPPNSGETINSIDVRVQDLEVFDHVPTSTWKKFVTCAIEPSARELKRPMINLQLLTVKPVTDLAASELVIKVGYRTIMILQIIG